MSRKKDTKIFYNEDLFIKAIESRGFKGDGAIAEITRALNSAGYRYSPQHVGAVLNTKKKPLNGIFVKKVMKALDIKESEISNKDSEIYQSLEDSGEKPTVSDNCKELRPDQIDVLKKWDKITDCRKRCALLALMDSMEG